MDKIYLWTTYLLDLDYIDIIFIDKFLMWTKCPGILYNFSNKKRKWPLIHYVGFILFVKIKYLGEHVNYSHVN